jgi:precorrin-2 dehydrogenase/sirohydrochlorin ferrochelatase
VLSIQLNVRNRRVVVVGAGRIGWHKAQMALRAYAHVRLVDPNLTPTIQPTQQFQQIRDQYRKVYLFRAFFAIAAATPRVNARVVQDARDLGCYVVNASDPEDGDAIFPAVHRDGDLTIAVSTNGASPTLALRLRDQLAERVPTGFPLWLTLLARIRTAILPRPEFEPHRAKLFRSLAEHHWLDRLNERGVEATYQEMLDHCERILQTGP